MYVGEVGNGGGHGEGKLGITSQLVNKSGSHFLPLKHGQVSTEGSEWELEIPVI